MRRAPGSAPSSSSTRRRSPHRARPISRRWPRRRLRHHLDRRRGKTSRHRSYDASGTRVGRFRRSRRDRRYPGRPACRSAWRTAASSSPGRTTAAAPVTPADDNSGYRHQRDRAPGEVRFRIPCQHEYERIAAVPRRRGPTDGSFVVAWPDRHSTSGDIKARIFRSNVVTSEFLVNTTHHRQLRSTATSRRRPTAASSSPGPISAPAPPRPLRSDRYQGAGVRRRGHEGRHGVSRQYADVRSLQSSPAIAGLANGGFVVVWADQSGTLGDAARLSIKAQVYQLRRPRARRATTASRRSPATIASMRSAASTRSRSISVWPTQP